MIKDYDGDLNNKLNLIDDELVDSLLEKFPFQSKEEVDIFWSLYNDVVVSTNDGNERDDSKEHDAIPDDDNRLRKHNFFSESNLPTSFYSLIVDHAMKMVYVSNIASSPNKQLYYFCEAVMSMIGRRGPIIELRLLHKYASLSIKGNECNKREKRLPEAKDLVELSYQLATYISSNIDNHNSGQPSSSSSSSSTAKTPETDPPMALINSLDKYNKEKNSNYMNGNDGISFIIFRQWVECLVPSLTNILSSFCRLTILGPSSYENVTIKSNRPMFKFPQFFTNSRDNVDMITTSSEFFTHLNDSALFSIVCMEPQLSTKWLRLYTNKDDGCSFFSLRKCIAGYGGPTLLLIRPTLEERDDDLDDSSIIGFFTKDGWKESRTYYGSSDCFLFRTGKSLLNVYRPKSIVSMMEDMTTEDSSSKSLFPTKKHLPTENYMFMSPSSYVGDSNPFAINKNIKHGLAVGGTLDNPRFCVSETLEGCIASPGGAYEDNTFVEGQLLSSSKSEEWHYNKYFNTEILEVWGIDTHNDNFQGALKSRISFSEQIDSAKRKVQQIRDKSAFLRDFQSGIYENSLFNHRDVSSHDHTNDDDVRKTVLNSIDHNPKA